MQVSREATDAEAGIAANAETGAMLRLAKQTTAAPHGDDGSLAEPHRPRVPAGAATCAS